MADDSQDGHSAAHVSVSSDYLPSLLPREPQSSTSASDVITADSAFPSTGQSDRRERPTTCLVCGEPASCVHYSVPTCMACKAFFRRTVVRRGYRRFKCHGGSCADNALKACPACRFSRCLMLGMNARTMRFKSQEELLEVDAELRAMWKALVKARGTNAFVEPVSRFPVEENSSGRLTRDLMHVEDKLLMLGESTFALNSGAKSVREELSRCCELGRGHKCEKPDTWPLTMKDIMALPKRRHWFMTDILLSLEMAKTLPGYSQIDLEDQAVHLQDVLLSTSMLTQAFYSYKKGKQTIFMPDGFMPVFSRMGQMERVGQDPGKLVEDSYVRPVMALHEVSVDVGEYVLLKALLYLRPAAPRLSARSEAILWEEYEKCASVLLKHLQQKLGETAGARKYAELLGVLNAFLHFAARYVELFTYLHVVHRYPERRHLLFLQDRL